MYTVFLKDAQQEPVLHVGSKALYLAKIINEGVTIPNGFVIKAEALRQFLQIHNLNNYSENAPFTAAFEQATLPSSMQDEIIEAFQQLKQLTGDTELKVAVRSSSSAEDLADASFAGQYDTILNVNEHNLIDAIKQCWASVFSDHARDYATQKNISLDQFPMSILVQQMVNPDAAGVIFSMNPITDSKDEIIINASFGLGEAVVSGIVTPDTFIVHKQTFTIERDLGLKEVMVMSTEDGITEVETPAAQCDTYCLTDEAIVALTNVTNTLEQFYGFPVDIEFAVKDNVPYILQSRPITA